MTLHRHVGDPEAKLSVAPLLSLPHMPGVMPRLRLPDEAIPPAVAAQLVRGELVLDGRAPPNLATFVAAWMEPEAGALMAETFDKHIVDRDEYPQTAELERRCVNILAELW